MNPLVCTLVSPVGVTVISMVFRHGYAHFQCHVAVGELPLRYLVALASGLQLALLDSVGLDKGVQVLLVAPAASVVVVLGLASASDRTQRGIASPVRLDGGALDLAGEQVVLAGDGRRRAQVVCRRP